MDFLLIFIASSAFALKGVLAKLAYAEGTSVEALLFIRFIAATPVYWIVAVYKSNIPQKEDWGYPALGYALLLSLTFLGAAYFDFVALTLIDASLERVILFTFPVFVIIYDLILEKKLPTRAIVIGFIVTEFGLCLVLGVFQSGIPGLEGCLWALACAVTYALYLRLSQPATQKHGSIQLNAVSNTFTTTITCVGFVLFYPQSSFGSAMGVFYCVLIGLFATALPFLLLFEAVRRMGAQKCSLLSMPGPIITVIAAMLILDEKLSLLQWLGMLVVIVGVAMIQLKPKGFGVGLPRILKN